MLPISVHQLITLLIQHAQSRPVAQLSMLTGAVFGNEVKEHRMSLASFWCCMDMSQVLCGKNRIYVYERSNLQ